MLKALGRLLIHKPLNILGIAGIFAVVWLFARLTPDLGAGRPNALLAPVVALLLYAGWEWLVMTRSPEADIRVDVLAIWLVLLVLTVWSFIRAFG